MGVKEPQWLSQAILSSHIRKPVLCVGWIVQASSEQVVRSSDGLGVHGTVWGVHETFWTSMGRVGAFMRRFGRPSDVLQMPYGIMTFLWHCYSALGKQFFRLFKTPAVFTACNTLASPTGFRSLWTDAISWENQYRTIASILRHWR